MNDNLRLKSINELLDEHFYIPHYQRGYRWTPQQVNDLLNDVWNFASRPKEKDEEFYCLQPVVVKQKTWNESDIEYNGWEVVDGQQRLTTIYIIISYLANEFLKVESLVEDYGKELFSLRYETRPRSAAFLKNITEDKSNIDFYNMWIAYKTIKDWFTNGKNTVDRTDKNRFLDTLLGKREDERSVQIIWYQVDPSANGIELFTRLNIGKIPLTNAELIKALFLASSSFREMSDDDQIRIKMEISQLWDEIEQKLSDEYFWSFVTNAKQKDFATKIEMLFDLIAKKKKDELDPLFTFLYFLKESKSNNKSLENLWLTIEQYYQTLCQWSKDKNLYHKIGYLITVGENLTELIDLSMKEKKSDFESILDRKIESSVKFDIEDLSYERPAEYKKIERVLLLFNVESIRSNESITEFYPFKFHKNINWSLEHIHAQNSESLDKTKQEPWLKWLDYHKALIEELAENESDKEIKASWEYLLTEIDQANNDKLQWEKFNILAQKIILIFSASDGNGLDMHSISNLALLSQPDNSALNNSVFEVKRREIIRLDKLGSYIPICTRRVFLKYYNDKQSTQQYYFWGNEDKRNYLKEIKRILNTYINEEEINTL